MNNNPIIIDIKKLHHAHDLSLPFYETEGASGLDFQAAVEKDLVLESYDRVLIPTGLCVAIPYGFELQIRPRSGLALKYGITVLNSPGTIDSDYRGEIKILIINLGKERFTISRGMRIAQGVFASVTKIQWQVKDALLPSNRNEKGFGSTGI